MSEAARVLQLGEPALRRKAERVRVPPEPEVVGAGERLVATLEAFRDQHGFARAIAAPQIGVALRLVALHLRETPFLMLNPEIVWRSPTRLTLWDDCMSFPSLLVRVERHASVSVRWQDADGAQHVWERLEPARSELLQHEIDHLDGILAVDRAVDATALVTRDAYRRQRAFFEAQVDYAIEPTG